MSERDRDTTLYPDGCSEGVSTLSGLGFVAGMRVGDYDLIEELARGGMGVVFRARQVSLGREVALKAVLPSVLSSDQARRRFQLEAQAVARMTHPCILGIYEVGQFGGVPYYSMPLLQGGSLLELLPELGRDLRRGIDLIRQVAGAVDYAHRHGILHRDLKPGNILVDSGGAPFLVDFGLARDLERQDGLTEAGAILGTPGYMAPEQMIGELTMTTACDVFSLGVILYELLTGERPFSGENVLELMLKVRHKEPIAPRKLRSGLPPELQTICLRCLEKQPTARYASAGLLAEDLQRWLDHRPILAQPVGLPARLLKWGRRHPALALLMAVLSLASGLIAGREISNGIRLRKSEKRAWDEQEKAETQYRLAVEARQVADVQRRRALKLKALADARERAGRRMLYASRLQQANQAWRLGQTQRLIDILESLRPGPGRPDLREFGWRLLNARRSLGEKISAPDWRVNGSGPLAISQDRRWLVLGTLFGTCVLVDLNTMREQKNWKAHSFYVQAMAVSGDGRYLLSKQHGQPPKLWEAITGRQLAVLSAPKEAGVLALSHDGRWAVAAGRQISWWRLDDRGRPAAVADRVGASQNQISSLAFSPDSQRLAVGDYDGNIRVFDAANGQLRAELVGHQGQVSCLSFSPDGKSLVSGGQDWSVRLWDLGRKRLRLFLRGHHGPVKAVAFSPGGDKLVTAEDLFVRLWDTRDGAPAGVIRGFSGITCGLGLGPDGRSLFVRDTSGLRRMTMARAGATWRPLVTITRRWGQRLPLFGVVQALAYTPDGKELITGGRSLPLFAGALQRWDCRAMAASGEPLISQAAMEGNDLAVSPDGTLIAVGQADKRVLLYDRKLRNPRLLIAHQFPVEQVAFSPDGKLLATRSSDFDGSNSELLVWDVQARRLKFNLEAPHQVLSMTFSPTGQLAHALRDGTVRLWQSGKAGPIIWGPQRRVPRMPLVEQVVLLRYSLDGRLLAIGTETRKLFILEAATGKVRHAVKAHAVEISALAFSPEGQTLATGATDRTIRLWDPALGVERLILDAGDPVRALAFSPDGRQLAAGLEPDILTTEQDPAKLAERLFPIKVWQAPRTRR